MTTRAAISCRGLTVRFGDKKAVSDLSFEVSEGAVCGIIGPNGAGKTTTIGILSTTLAPHEGSGSILGLDIRREAASVRRRIGWMPESVSLYPELTLAEYLEFFARFYGLSPQASRSSAAACIELTRLEAFSARRLKGLSRGERQRVSLARALVHDPSVLLLDEPAEGLDPGGRLELKELLLLLQERGKTILVSSHILSELEAVCTEFVFIRNGSLAAKGSMEELRSRSAAPRIYRAAFLDPPARFAEAVAAVPDVRIVRSGEGWADVEVGGDGGQRAALVARAVGAGIRLTEFSPRRSALEEEFLRLEGDEGGA